MILTHQVENLFQVKNAKKKKDKKNKKEMSFDKLKEEVEMDDHKISLQALCLRLQTNDEKVCLNH